MDKYENMDNFQTRTHILEVTLQSGEHKGTFKARIGGNGFGAQVLNFFDNFEDIDGCDAEVIIENECQITFSDWWFKCYLANKDWRKCEVENEMRELGSLVVKLEIVDCTIDPKINTK